MPPTKIAILTYLAKIYKDFQNCIVLTQTIRYKLD